MLWSCVFCMYFLTHLHPFHFREVDVKLHSSVRGWNTSVMIWMSSQLWGRRKFHLRTPGIRDKSLFPKRRTFPCQQMEFKVFWRTIVNKIGNLEFLSLTLSCSSKSTSWFPTLMGALSCFSPIASARLWSYFVPHQRTAAISLVLDANISLLGVTETAPL